MDRKSSLLINHTTASFQSSVFSLDDNAVALESWPFLVDLDELLINAELKIKREPRVQITADRLFFGGFPASVDWFSTLV